MSAIFPYSAQFRRDDLAWVQQALLSNAVSRRTSARFPPPKTAHMELSFSAHRARPSPCRPWPHWFQDVCAKQLSQRCSWSGHCVEQNQRVRLPSPRWNTLAQRSWATSPSRQSPAGCGQAFAWDGRVHAHVVGADAADAGRPTRSAGARLDWLTVMAVAPQHVGTSLVRPISSSLPLPACRPDSHKIASSGRSQRGQESSTAAVMGCPSSPAPPEYARCNHRW
jgi:hypothetical protein